MSGWPERLGADSGAEIDPSHLKIHARPRMLMLMPSEPARRGLPACRTNPPASRANGARRVLLASGLAATAALVAFHVHLFWQQLADGRLLDGDLALRWSLGLVLTGALVVLKRSGVPLLWGRRALAVWVLVAFLHGGQAMPATPGDASVPQPVSVSFELPSTLAALVVGLGLLTLLLRRRHLTLAPARRRLFSEDARVEARPVGLLRVRCPRPPPLYA